MYDAPHREDVDSLVARIGFQTFQVSQRTVFEHLVRIRITAAFRYLIDMIPVWGYEDELHIIRIFDHEFHITLSKFDNLVLRIIRIQLHRFLQRGRETAGNLPDHRCQELVRIGFRWRFGIGIGAGEFIRENKDKVTAENKLYRNVYNALYKLAIELEGQETVQQSDIMTNPAIPRFLFMAAANYFWAGRAGKSGVDLKRKVWPDLL